MPGNGQTYTSHATAATKASYTAKVALQTTTIKQQTTTVAQQTTTAAIHQNIDDFFSWLSENSIVTNLKSD